MVCQKLRSWPVVQKNSTGFSTFSNRGAIFLFESGWAVHCPQEVDFVNTGAIKVKNWNGISRWWCCISCFKLRRKANKGEGDLYFYTVEISMRFSCRYHRYREGKVGKEIETNREESIVKSAECACVSCVCGWSWVWRVKLSVSAT